jgi:hypothetical protein
MNLSTTKYVATSSVLVVAILLSVTYFLIPSNFIIAVVLPMFLLGILLLFIYLSLKKITVLTLLNLFVITAYCVTLYDFGYRPNAFSQIAGMILFCGLIVLIILDCISVFVFWGKHGFSDFIAVIMVFISLLSFKAGSVCLSYGKEQRLKIFSERLPQYEEVVRLMDSKVKSERVFWQYEQIPQQYRHLAYRVYGERNENALRVFFFWGSGFPVKHSAFAYISNGVLPVDGDDFHRD